MALHRHRLSAKCYIRSLITFLKTVITIAYQWLLPIVIPQIALIISQIFTEKKPKENA
jgi:hypothetical protein